MKQAEDAEINGFKGSDGWLNGALTRNGLKIINLHGEEYDLMGEEITRAIVPWREELREIIEDKYVTASFAYNADKTGLFYDKLPKSLYVKKQ